MSHSPSTQDIEDADRYRRGWSQMMELIRTGGSWSGHEPNSVFLNTTSQRFADISAVSGLNFADDARAIASTDWDQDGDLDLWIVNRTGPRLRFVRNDSRTPLSQEMPQSGTNFVQFLLEGTTSNRDAIGARIEVQCADRTLIATRHAGDGYLAQSSQWLHFGIDDASRLNDVRVRWPGGDVESFGSLAGNSRYRLVEGSGTANAVKSASHAGSIAAGPGVEATSSTRRIVIQDTVPVPNLNLSTDSPSELAAHKPLLLNIWATWCVPCLGELKELADRASEIDAAGLQVHALNVDDLTQAESDSEEAVTKMLQELKFPYPVSRGTEQQMQTLDALQNVLISLRQAPDQIPVSYLLDDSHRLAVIYIGRLDVDQLLADVRALSKHDLDAFPFAGRWYKRPYGTIPLMTRLANEFSQRDDDENAADYASLAANQAEREAVSTDDRQSLASVLLKAGKAAIASNRLQRAYRELSQASRLEPTNPEIHVQMAVASQQLNRSATARHHLAAVMTLVAENNAAELMIGSAFLEYGLFAQAVPHLRRSVTANPENATAHHALGVALAGGGQRIEAIRHLRRAIQLDPGFTDARQHLQQILSGKPQ